MNNRHDPLDARLRQLAHELNDAAPAPHEWGDIAIPSLVTALGADSEPRPRWPLAAVAAAVVLFVIAGLVVIRSATDDRPPPFATVPGPVVDGTVDPSIPWESAPTIVVPNTTSPIVDTTIAAEQSSTTTVKTLPTTAAVNLPPIRVTYLDSPPVLELDPIATIEVAFDPVRGFPAASVVTLEGGAFAVVDLLAGEIIVIDPTTGERRISLDPAMPDLTGLAVGGPDGIVYVVLHAGRQTSQSATEIVAIPTDGPRAGRTVGTASINLVNYTHTHPSVLGLGPTSVIDKRTGESLIDYVDSTGEPLQVQLPAPAYPLAQSIDIWSTFETGLDVAPANGSSPKWHVEVDREPTASGGLGHFPEPTAIDYGRVLVTTAIGPNLPGDYGSPTQQVIAVLEPDGSGSWWSVPDGWSLEAADLYGPLYTRITDNTLEIARPPSPPT